ncbi:MAG TPA: zinc ABC transporter substrate-binding protein, partial [Euzebya sp.]|nr:zinc ABC transporter substrate-binding protein [Euzebya sp.]
MAARRLLARRLLVRRLLALALPVVAMGCTESPLPVARQERPVVVTSTTVFADLVQQVAGDLVEVRSLVGIGGDPHTHEPRPS